VTRYPIAGALGLFLALAVVLTWPQALHLGTDLARHQDSLFSVWRLEWVAHALATDPRHLFDANIFYPSRRTLAFSDAMMFEGLVAAPWLWAHANPILVYNVLLLGGMVTSGLGMFLLVRSLTGNMDAALVAGAIFTMAPYRVEHFVHLELQWTVWMPLTLWAVHRTFATGRMRDGLIAGALLWLQTISCIYYGVYLGIIASALTLLLAVGHPRAFRRAAMPLAAGVVLALLLTAPYAVPYILNARVLGPRAPGEIADFSARLNSYFLAPTQNWLWGWTGTRVGGDELHLFPGAIAVALALAAFAGARRRLVWIYLAIVGLAVELSFGVNTAPYRWLYEHVSLFGGFRAPARFGILACCGLAVLAGFGFDTAQRRLSDMGRRVLLVAVLIGVAVESGSAPMNLQTMAPETPPVYKFIALSHQPVIIEFPFIDWDLSPDYMYWSTKHWASLVNGYSGYTPSEYFKTRDLMRRFPDRASIGRLRALGVRYVLVHEAFYKPRAYVDLMSRAATRTELLPVGRFRDWEGPTQIFEIRSPPD